MGPVFVFIAIMIAIGIASYMTVNAFSRERKKGIGAKIAAIAVCIAAAVFTVAVADYLDPGDRTVEYELYAVVELDEPHSSAPRSWSWIGVYEDSTCEYSAESFLSRYGEEWPELDVSEYSYIICYGQKLRSLAYNVWNSVDIPFVIDVYQGKAILYDGFDPYTIYIYKIPKLKIDNYPY